MCICVGDYYSLWASLSTKAGEMGLVPQDHYTSIQRVYTSRATCLAPGARMFSVSILEMKGMTACMPMGGKHMDYPIRLHTSDYTLRVGVTPTNYTHWYTVCYSTNQVVCVPAVRRGSLATTHITWRASREAEWASPQMVWELVAGEWLLFTNSGVHVHSYVNIPFIDPYLPLPTSIVYY